MSLSVCLSVSFPRRWPASRPATCGMVAKPMISGDNKHLEESRAARMKMRQP